MTPRTFAVTWDYRCPFARNAHEHVIEGLRAGAPWEVRFVPFSLGQVHVAEGEADVWDEPAKDSGLHALQVGVAVRDQYPDQFLAVHRALFAARHDEARDLRDPSIIAEVLRAAGFDPAAMLAAIGRPEVKDRLKAVTEEAVARGVFGAPTFFVGKELFFGQDRLDFVEEEAKKAA